MMSEENVEIVGATIDAIEMGDAETALSYFSEDVVFEPLVAGPYYGHAGVLEQWAVFIGEFDDYWFKAERFIDAGDEVVLFWRHGGIGKASGISVEDTGGTVFSLKDHRIARARVYADRAEALNAARLSE